MPAASIRQLAVCLALAGLAGGCMSYRLGDALSPDDPDYPRENRAAVHHVEVRGKLPPAVEPRLFAQYVASRDEGCKWAPTLIAGAFEGAIFRISLPVPLVIARDGDQFQSRFTVDRFEPGRCGWRFVGVTAAPAKGRLASLGNTIVRNMIGYENRIKPARYSNAEDTPVVWRCRFSDLADLKEGESMFACAQWSRANMSKQEHLLTSASRRVRLDFEDLDAK
ncbi:MAG: hypothetical protein R3E48_04520 [Burkholderiaceae bacterium]